MFYLQVASTAPGTTQLQFIHQELHLLTIGFSANDSQFFGLLKSLDVT